MSFLPGMFPAGVLKAAGAVVATLTQQASATSTAATVTGPAGVLSGDLLVLWDCAEQSGDSPAAFVMPTGFVCIADVTLPSINRGILSAKVANGSEASASLTGMSGSLMRKQLYVFRGDTPITAFSVGDLWGESTDGNPNSQTVAAGSGVAPLVVLGCYRATAAIDPRTFSPAKDGEITAATTAYLAYKIYNSSPANVSIDQDDEGNNLLVSCYLRPAAIADPFPQVGNTGFGQSADAGTATTATVTLPVGIVSGDLLVMTLKVGANAARTIATPSGWTQIFNDVGGGDVRRLAAYYRVADGSEGASVAVTLSAASTYVSQVQRIKAGTYQGTPEAGTTATGSGTANPNPPSLTPSWGADDTLWLAVEAHFASTGGLPTALPANYQISTMHFNKVVGNPSGTLSVARRRLNTATEDPGVFTIGATQWAANTIAIRGA